MNSRIRKGWFFGVRISEQDQSAIFRQIYQHPFEGFCRAFDNPNGIGGACDPRRIHEKNFDVRSRQNVS